MAGLGDSFMLPKPGQDTEHLWLLIGGGNSKFRIVLLLVKDGMRRLAGPGVAAGAILMRQP